MLYIDDSIPNCPRCLGSDTVPIVHGEPSPLQWLAAELGDVVLGASVPDRLEWACRQCGQQWGGSANFDVPLQIRVLPPDEAAAVIARFRAHRS